MRKIVNDRRMTKEGKERLEYLLNSPLVNNYHKTLLKGIKSGLPKNLSKADCEMFDLLIKQYEGL